MTDFDRNISALKRIHPNFEFPETISSAEKIEILAAGTGDPTAQIDGILLHSRLDPRREARRIAAATGEYECVVFFGFGLGYYVEEYLALYPASGIIVVENDPALFKTAIGTRDLSMVLTAPNLSLLLNTHPDALASVLNTNLYSAVGVVAPKNLIRRDEGYYKSLQTVIETFSARREINRNTLKRFGKRWIRNLAANIRYLPSAGRLHSLSGTLKGVPALLLAAGPSLDRVLHHLPELAERFVIFAVDTSLRAALSAGVKPDFLVVVDPQYWNVRHLDGCVTSGTVLITESATYPSVFRRDYRAVYLGASLFPLGSFLEEGLGEFGKLGAGGSVATSAWDAARQLGCSPIYTAGLDLGYPKGNTHFTGGRFEDLQMCRAHRFAPAETGSHAMVTDASPFFVESNTGEMVQTDKRLITYKWWFENQLKIYHEVRCGNLSEGGVKIEGMVTVPVKDLLDYQKIDKSSPALQEAARTMADETISSRREILKTAVGDLLDELGSLHSLASNACSLTSRLSSAGALAGASLDATMLNTLDRIDKQLLSHRAKEVVGFLIHDFAQEILDEKGKEASAKEVLERSLIMYEHLRESAAYHIKILREAGG